MIVFLIGLCVGTALGVVVLALCRAAKDGKDEQTLDTPEVRK